MLEYIISDFEDINLSVLFGPYDYNFKKIEKAFNVDLLYKQDSLIIRGNDDDNLNKAKDVIEVLLSKIKNGSYLEQQTVDYIIDISHNNNFKNIIKYDKDIILLSNKSRPIKAKTMTQRLYVDSIKNNSVVFGVGAAGTGKTYLAVALAVKLFKESIFDKIILTRPAVEAGEKLGFLPGDLQNKIDPYLRPLYDALYEFFGFESYSKLIEKSAIEIAPLAYLRGRTLDNAFIILDEAQNTTVEQMKMFLTRLGQNSKAVITGDVTQIDLPSYKRSGLLHALKILKNIDDIDIITFKDTDVVRHKLVKEIIKAYQIDSDKDNKMEDLKIKYNDKSLKSNNNK